MIRTRSHGKIRLQGKRKDNIQQEERKKKKDSAYKRHGKCERHKHNIQRTFALRYAVQYDASYSVVGVPGQGQPCGTAPPNLFEPAMLGEPINTSARPRGKPRETDLRRLEPNEDESQHEARRVPTTSSVAGSVVVREWSLRDVWYRN